MQTFVFFYSVRERFFYFAYATFNLFLKEIFAPNESAPNSFWKQQLEPEPRLDEAYGLQLFESSRQLRGFLRLDALSSRFSRSPEPGRAIFREREGGFGGVPSKPSL
jgi:hypothetical protein